jgi:nitroreductase
MQERLLPAISDRRSIRAFSTQDIEKEALTTLMEAARWSPSCCNEQPWRFIIGQKSHNPAVWQAICESLYPANQDWAKEAPVLLATFTKKTFTQNGRPNRHAWHDLGAALAMLSVQAFSMGIFVHQMAGFQPEKITETFSPPADFEPVTVVVLGYPGDPARLPESVRAKENAPRNRKPLEEFVFWRGWKA